LVYDERGKEKREKIEEERNILYVTNKLA